MQNRIHNINITLEVEPIELEKKAFVNFFDISRESLGAISWPVESKIKPKCINIPSTSNSVKLEMLVQRD